MPFGELLGACLAATGSDAVIRWMPSAELLAKGVDPWMGVPMWVVAAAGWEAANDVDTAKAIRAGLSIRPLPDTVRDTLAWDLARVSPTGRPARRACPRRTRPGSSRRGELSHNDSGSPRHSALPSGP
jgi:hypothetical protein